MNIGLDFDGVIFDFEKNLATEAELYDDELREKGLKSGVLNSEELRFQERYNWSSSNQKYFLEKYFKIVNEYSEFVPGAKVVLDKLKADGHKLIIISARGLFSDEEIEIAEQKIKEKGFIFDEHNWKIYDKLKMCKDKNIDIMIDDYAKTCEKISKNGIKTIYFRDKTYRKLEENENLKDISNWGTIYKYIKTLE